jgi:DNA end-binding protein Ku
MAESLVESLSATFEPEKYTDQYREQVLDLIKIKASGEELTAPEAPADKPKVIDLMAALEASVQAAKDARGRHPAASSVSTKSAAKPAKASAAKKTPAKKAAPKRKSA